MTPNSLRLSLFGGLTLEFHGAPIHGLASRKAEALLAYLACQTRPQSREILSTILWDDLPQHRSLGNLSVLLSSFRKQSLEDVLLINRQEIGISPAADIWVDVNEFETAVHQINRERQIAGRLTRQTSHRLRQALKLYQGEFLAGFNIRKATGFEEWVLITRERTQQLMIDGLTMLLEYYEAKNDFENGIEIARSLIHLDPLLEWVHVKLMQFFAWNGQRTAALDQYEMCCNVLAADLGIDPAPETVAVYQKIKANELQAAEMDSSSAPAPHNLLPTERLLIGRADELDLIVQQLQQSTCRLLTLVGPGGVGKTRLAQAAGWELLAEYFHGIWFKSLASLQESAYLATAVANAIGFKFSGRHNPQQELINYLQQKEMLLILDNFEHILNHDSVALIQQILQQAPDVHILITSRERLNIQFEWLIQINGLPLPPTTDSDLMAYGAIQLFMNRVQQVDPRFRLNNETKTAVFDICHTVMGLPLGIELAAASVRYYPVAQIATEIHHNNRFLTSSQRDIPDRHRSIEAVFDHSWRLLSAEEQRVLAALSAFQGTFSLDAAQTVAKCDNKILQILVDKSLLHQEGNGRFHLHDLIQKFGAEKLNQKPAWRRSARGRHGTYYGQLLASKADALKGGQQLEALNHILAEIENVRAGWHYAQSLDREAPGLMPLLHQAIDALFHFYAVKSWFLEGSRLFGQAANWLEPPQNETEMILQARLSAREGWFRYLLGDARGGGTLMKKAFITFKQLGFESDQLFCCNYLGVIAMRGQDWQKAEQLLEQGQDLADRLDDLYGKAVGLNILGSMAVQQQQYETAAAFLSQSLAIKRKLNDRWGMAFSLEKLGDVDMALGNLAQAKKLFEEGLAIRQELGDLRGMGHCYHCLADIATKQERLDEAEVLKHNSLQAFAEIGVSTIEPN